MGKRSGSSRSRTFVASAALLASITAVERVAHADGGNPRAYQFVFEPGNSARLVARSQYWGLFDNRGGTGDWWLLCSRAWGARTTDAADTPTVIARGGRILVAGDFAGLVVTDDVCDWRKIDAFQGWQVVDVEAADDTGVDFLAIALHNDGHVGSRVHASTDRGDSWSPLAGAFPQDYSAMRVARAPSDPSRIYVAGVITDVNTRLLGVSTDAGKTFSMLPIGAPTDYDPAYPAPLSIAAVDPNDANVVFVRADGADNTFPPIDDELWVTRDAGKTWNKAYSPKADLPAFTYSPDGASIFVGGNLTGVATATVADALRQGPSAFHKVFGNAVWGLAFDGGKLYAGNDDYAMKPPFMVGVSTNEAETFSPVMNHCQVTFPTCPATSTMESACRNEWERYGGYAYDQLQTDDCAKRLAASGGAAGAPAMTPSASVTGTGPGNGGSLTGAGGVGPSPSGAGGIAESPAATTGHDGSASCSTARRARGPDLTSVLVAVAALSAAGARARRRSRRPVRFTRRALDPL